MEHERSPRTPRWIVVAALAGGTAILAWLGALDRARERAAPSPEAVRSPEGGGGERPAPERGVPAAPAPPGVPELERRPLALGPLAGVLRDAAGEPLAGAELSWTALLPEYEPHRYLRDMDLERLRARTAWCASDAAGRFAFPALPEGALAHDSVVWVTAPGRAASAVLVPPPRTSWSWTGTLDAPARESCRVRVTRGGAPLPGARVRQLLDAWAPEILPGEKRVRRVFLREAPTDAAGEAAFAPGPLDNALQAFHGAESSILWTGEPARSVVLEIVPTLRIAGVVLVDAPGFDFADVRYGVAFYSAPDRSDVVHAAASQAVRGDGGFGPDAWPRPDHRRMTVTAYGGDVVTRVEDMLAPAAGAELFVELETSVGFHLFLEVLTSAGERVPSASVTAFHWDGAAWNGLKRVATGEDGTLDLGGLPAGQLLVEVGRRGFTTETIDDHRAFMPRREEGPLRVVLHAAGVVAGRVVCEGAPVRDFYLVGWTDAHDYEPTARIQDEQGRFRLEDAPLGKTLHLFAYTDELPQSEPTTVVPAAEPAELVLELPRPRKARGRVVDSQTGEPIPTATIEHLTSGMKGLAGFRGALMHVERDGSFELDGFHPGRGGFRVQAEAYESLNFFTREDEVETIDVGLLALNPLAILDVRVRAEGAVDLSSIRAWNRYNDEQTPVPLSPDGTLRLPSRTGVFLLNLLLSDGTVAAQNGIVLPGETVIVEFDLTGGIELAVETSAPVRDAAHWVLQVHWLAGERERRVEGRWQPAREVFVARGPGAGDVVLELRDASGAIRARRSARLSAEPFQTLVLDLSDPERRIRLVDEQGRPWTAAVVQIALDDASGWYAIHEPDSAGEFAIGPLAESRVLLSAKLGSEYIAYGIPVALEPAGTTEVVIPRGERSWLSLMEEGRPCAGVHVAYGHERAPRSIEFTYISDESGLVRGPLCLRQLYRVRINHSAYWPTLFFVEPRGTSNPVRLELRSRGVIEFSVVDGRGAALAGARLDLVHEELGEDAGEWVREGLIPGVPGELTSDARGRLLLEGIPRGRYAWTWSVGGASATGVVGLGARGREVVEVRIDV